MIHKFYIRHFVFFSSSFPTERFFGLTGVGCARPASFRRAVFCAGRDGRTLWRPYKASDRIFSFSTFFYWSNEISVTPPSSATVKERAMRHPRPVCLISINPQQKIKPTVFFALFFFSFFKIETEGLDRWRRCRLDSREIKGKDSSRATKVTYPIPNRFSFLILIWFQKKTC